LLRMYKLVQERTGEDPIVVDAQDFMADPESVMRQYCEYVGAPFNPAWLSWEAGQEVTELKIWDGDKGGWHDEVKRSTGVNRVASTGPKKREMPPRVLHMIDRARPLYDQVLSSKRRIKPVLAS
jgi:Sulfotransferase domain